MKSKVVYDKTITTLPPYGVEVLFARDKDGRVVDILIPMKDNEYSQFLLHFEDQHQDWKRSSYVYIFQNQLTAYQQWYDENIDTLDPEEKAGENLIKAWMDTLRECTQQYAYLEDLVNKHLGIGGELPGDILEILDNIKKELKNKFKDLPPEIYAKLFKDLDSFTERAKEVVNKLPRDPVEIRHLFSLTRENKKLPCLGHFLSKQLYELASIGQKQVNLITDENNKVRGKFYNRLKNQFEPQVCQNRLSDAKSQVERKRSAYGTEYNSNWAVIPPGMLNALRVSEDKTSPPRFTSMGRYIKRMDDREEVDHVLRQVAHIKDKESICPKNYHEMKLPLFQSLWRGGVRNFSAVMVVLFSIVEMVIPSVIPRLVLSVAVGAVGYVIRDLIYNPIRYAWNQTRYFFGWLRGKNNDTLMNQWDRDEKLRSEGSEAINKGLDFFDSGLSAFHEISSPVIFFKEMRDGHYAKDPQMRPLHLALGPSESFFKTMLDTYDSGQFSNYFRDMTKSILRTVLITPVIGLRNAFMHPFQNQKQISQKYQQRANDKLRAEFLKMWKDADEHQAETLAPVVDKNGLGKYHLREGVSDMENPDIQSFMHFMQSIVVVLGDDIFDSVFRKSPGLATLAFMAATASFGIMLAPGGAPLFAAFSNAFAKAAMGKEAGTFAHGGMTAVMNDMFTAVLQFKALFLSMEGAKALTTGESKILRDIFRNPEEAMLAFCVSSAVGVLMGMVPAIPGNLSSFRFGLMGQHFELPNVYAAGFNLFVTEAAEALHHGTWGATSIEFSFLSIKMGFMIQSLGEGLHRPSRDPNPILDKMIVHYKTLDVKPINEHEIAQAFENLLSKESLNAEDKALLIKQFHYSLIFDAMLKAHKIETDAREKIYNTDYIEWKRNGKIGKMPAVNNDFPRPNPEDMHNQFIVILKAHGILGEEEKQYFLNGFNQAHNFAKEKTMLSMRDLSVPTEEVVVAPPVKDNKSQLEKDRQKLMEMFRLVRNLEMSGTSIDSSVEKNTLYDMIYESVDEYNKSCVKAGYPGLQFDGTDYLQSFYNKYVYRGSNNFVRSLQMFTPLAFFVYVVWRPLQYALVDLYKGMGYPSHALEQKLTKSAAKDKFLLYQFVSMFGRLGQSATRAVTYGIARGGIFTAMAVAYGVRSIHLWLPNVIATVVWAPLGMIYNLGSWKTTRNDIADIWNPEINPLTKSLKAIWNEPMSKAIDFANTVRWYATAKYATWWRTGYARAVAVADTHSSNLTELSEKAIETLERHEEIIQQQPQPLLMYSTQGKEAANRAESMDNIVLEKEYNQLFLNVDHLQKSLSKRFENLTPEQQAVFKADPNFGELNIAGKMLSRFAEKPPKNEIYMQSYVERLRVYQANLLEIDKQFIELEAPRPRNKR